MFGLKSTKCCEGGPSKKKTTKNRNVPQKSWRLREKGERATEKARAQIITGDKKKRARQNMSLAAARRNFGF